MFLKTLALGLAGLVLTTLASCKTKEIYIPSFFLQTIGTELIETEEVVADERQSELEKILAEVQEEGEEGKSLKGIFYYGGEYIEKIYSTLEDIGLNEKEIEWAKIKLERLPEKIHAMVIHGSKGNVIIYSKNSWRKGSNSEDRKSTLVHEWQHLKDFEKYGVFKNVFEKNEWEVRAYTAQLVDAYENERKLSLRYTEELGIQLQNYLALVYISVIQGYDQGQKTVLWVHEQLEGLGK